MTLAVKVALNHNTSNQYGEELMSGASDMFTSIVYIFSAKQEANKEHPETLEDFDSQHHEFCIPCKEVGPGPESIPKWEKSQVKVDWLPPLIPLRV